MPIRRTRRGESEGVEIECERSEPEKDDSEDWELVCEECEEGEDPSGKAKAGPKGPSAREREEH